jgi:hypothetical protein
MNPQLRFAVVAVLAGAVSGACVSGRIAPRTLQQDEHEVLLAIIQHMESEDGDPNPVFGVMTMEDLAEADYLIPDAEILEEEKIRFPMEVFPDLLRRNGGSVPLRPLIGDSTRVRWITQAQQNSLQAANGPGVSAGSPVLERIYPGLRSTNWLSRPGFDEPRTHAAVAYGWWCPGGLCGAAGIYLLERRGGRWRVVHRLAMLVS